MNENESKNLIPIERIERIIYVIREQKVMLDRDLAKLYGVTTKRLNEQIRRNSDRFPEDFSFQLSTKEWKVLRSQIATLNEKVSERGKHSKYLPYVFTEHGVVMLANVIKSKRATLMSIEVVRAFIKLRQVLSSHRGIIKELSDIKSFLLKHTQKSDQEFRKVWQAIEKLSTPIEPEQRIGFKLK